MQARGVDGGASALGLDDDFDAFHCHFGLVAGDPQLDGTARGALERVGESFLRDVLRGEFDGWRRAGHGLDFDIDRYPRALVSGGERREVRQPGSRRLPGWSTELWTGRRSCPVSSSAARPERST